MNREVVQAWLDGYLAAWARQDPEPIRALFTKDAVYRYRPYPGSKVLKGEDEIVEGWLEHKEGPDQWEASYEVFAVDEHRAVATGISRYFGDECGADQVYCNCFLLRFAGDGRCAEFTEYWMRPPEDA
jgi:ketosteroid isomerase-like protein